MDKTKIPTWVLLSVAEHFNNSISGIDIFVEGSRKQKIDSTWAEIRVEGPDISESCRDDVSIDFTINVLIATLKDTNDLIAQEKNIQKVMPAFTNSIQICKFGQDTGDDGEILGCAKIVEVSGKTIRLHKYGNIDRSTNILQCTIEARYVLITN